MPNQPTAAPVKKTTAGALAGAVVTIAVWAARAFAHVEVPPEIAASAVVVVTFGVSYVVPE